MEYNNYSIEELEGKLQQFLKVDFEKCEVIANQIIQLDPTNYLANYSLAMIKIPSILLEYSNLLERFKKDLYEDSFKSYLSFCKPIFDAIQHACDAQPEEKETIIKDCTDVLVKAVVKDVANNQKKAEQERKLDNYKSILALFTIPMIEELGLSCGEFVTETIRDRWIEEFPKKVFYKGNYKELKEGFEKKGFCYITTAVCEIFGKPDDCKELTLFRKFRDDYLLEQEDGKEIISNYYSFSPLIVNHINRQEKRNEIYQEIWKNHLSICMQNIEDGNNQMCKENYMKMVKELQQKYL